MPDVVPWQDGMMDFCALWLSIIAASFILVWVASLRRRVNDQTLLNLARLQAEEKALLECNHRFVRLTEKMRDMVWITSVRGRKTMFINAAFEKITGRTCQSLYDQPDCRDLIHPDDRAQAEAKLVRQVMENDESAVEFRIVREDKAIRWVRCRGFLSSKDFSEGNPFGWIVEDITDLKLAKETIRRISVRLQRVQDDERRRIARDLHDSTSQTLTALVLTLTALQKSNDPGSGKARRALEESLALANQCSREVRSISYLLHPPLLEEFGLISALRHFVTGVAQRSSIQVDLEVAPDFPRLVPEIELGIFRVVQESLINARRHSGSTTAKVTVWQDSDMVRLEVSDQGRGLPSELLSPDKKIVGGLGVGIAGMQERVEQLGGWVEIESTSQGTTVRASFPNSPAQD